MQQKQSNQQIYKHEQDNVDVLCDKIPVCSALFLSQFVFDLFEHGSFVEQRFFVFSDNTRHILFSFHNHRQACSLRLTPFPSIFSLSSFRIRNRVVIADFEGIAASELELVVEEACLLHELLQLPQLLLPLPGAQRMTATKACL